MAFVGIASVVNFGSYLEAPAVLEWNFGFDAENSMRLFLAPIDIALKLKKKVLIKIESLKKYCWFLLQLVVELDLLNTRFWKNLPMQLDSDEQHTLKNLNKVFFYLCLNE